MTTPEHERAPPPDVPASAEEPPRSEALAAELAALEAILPAGAPAVMRRPDAATEHGCGPPAAVSPTPRVPPAARE